MSNLADHLKSIFPFMHVKIYSALNNAPFPKYGINTDQRLIYFLAQCAHETGYFARCEENLNYSAERLVVVWPSRFLPKGKNDPKLFAHRPEALGNLVYSNRMGNGANEGFKFRGRGLLMTTGKDNYTKLGKEYVANPDAILADTIVMFKAAASYWQSRGCNELADSSDIEKVTRAINGGLIGIEDRIKLVAKLKAKKIRL
jgi:putative chitinase